MGVFDGLSSSQLWHLSNRSGATYTFGRQVLLPDETVTPYTGEGTDTRSAVYWGRSSEAWTDTGTVSLAAGGGAPERAVESVRRRI